MGDRLAEVVDNEFFDRVPDVVLGAVMMDQQPDRHAGRRGNRPHRGAVFALAGVEVERSVADPGLSCQVLIACAGVPLWRHLHLIIAILSPVGNAHHIQRALIVTDRLQNSLLR